MSRSGGASAMFWSGMRQLKQPLSSRGSLRRDARIRRWHRPPRLAPVDGAHPTESAVPSSYQGPLVRFIPDHQERPAPAGPHVLTTLGLAIAIAAVTILVGISWNFERSFLAIYNSKGIDLVVVHAGSSNQLCQQPRRKTGRSLAADRGRRRRRSLAGGHGRVRGTKPGERAGQRLDSRQHSVSRNQGARRPDLCSRATTRPSCSAACWP